MPIKPDAVKSAKHSQISLYSFSFWKSGFGDRWIEISSDRSQNKPLVFPK
jgi:hypothetical protein